MCVTSKPAGKTAPFLAVGRATTRRLHSRFYANKLRWLPLITDPGQFSPGTGNRRDPGEFDSRHHGHCARGEKKTGEHLTPIVSFVRERTQGSSNAPRCRTPNSARSWFSNSRPS